MIRSGRTALLTMSSISTMRQRQAKADAARAEPAAKGTADVKFARPKRTRAPWTWSGVALTLALFVGALLTRFCMIKYPSEVVFDEVHFGKFAAYYIRGEVRWPCAAKLTQYFFDVHPPLAKLLVALAAWLSGCDGKFEFEKIGESYLENNVPYFGIRAMSAVLGSLVVPRAYQTLRETGVSVLASVVCALMLILGAYAQAALTQTTRM